MCAAQCVCVTLKEVDIRRRISDSTCVRLRAYGKWELLPVKDKLMVDIRPQRRTYR